MLTRATVPFGLPQAPRIPVCSLSAPAHDNILLMRTTWYGCARTRRWKPSLPATLTRYLRLFVSRWRLSSLELNVLVGADTGSFQRFGTQLLILVGDHVDAEREFVDICTLSTKVEDSDLWIGHSSIEPCLRKRLSSSVYPAEAKDYGVVQTLFLQ